MRVLLAPLLLPLLTMPTQAVTPETSTTAKEDSAEPTAPAPPDLSGTWHLRMRTATDAKVRIIGTTHIKTTTHLLIQIATEGEEILQSQKTCLVDSRPSRNFTRTILPDAFIEHLAQKTYPIRVAPTDDGGWAYDADLKQQFVGYHGHLAPDDIPRDKKHPAVYDWDEDGKPGASVLVDLPLIGHIRIYMVQTNHTFLTGRVDADGVIRGRTHQRLLKQHTIGADNRLLAASPRLSVGTGHDAFEMMRLPEGATCAEVKTAAAGTF